MIVSPEIAELLERLVDRAVRKAVAAEYEDLCEKMREYFVELQSQLEDQGSYGHDD